jgi:hypothetical protein
MQTKANPGRELGGSAGAEGEKPCPDPTGDWQQRLPQLEGLPLLPCGAGKDHKAPLDPATGLPATGWQTAAYTPAQIAAMNGKVRCVGTRCGPDAAGLLVGDLDGASAIEAAMAHGIDPAETWTIGRTTAGDRVKVAYRVPERLWPLLQQKGKVKHPTGAGEQVEVFWSTGQVVVLGEHITSGGTYTWTGAPDCIATMDEAHPAWPWLLQLLGVRPPERQQRPPAGATGRDAIPLPDLLSREHSRLWQQGAAKGSRNDDLFRLAVGLLTAAEGAAAEGLRVDGDPEALALDWAARCSPPLPEREALQTIRSAQQQPRTPDPGLPDRIDYQRSRKRNTPPPSPHASQEARGQQQQQPAGKQQQSKARRSWEERNRQKLSHSRAMKCMERCIEVQAKVERNSLRRRARLLKAAHDLQLQRYIKAQDIAQRVLEAKDGAAGNTFRSLSAADRAAMPKPVLRWLLPGLIPDNDMTIIGGRPKVGKTRLAVAIAAAVLRGESMLDLPAPPEAKPVVLVTDDQSDGDSADMLEAVGMWNHPRLFWSQSFRLTEENIDALLEAIKANPGALVIIDSLRSIGRSLQHGENDPEIGAVLYDLKQAVMDAGGTLLLIHHCNKAMDLVGVEALSGHNAISGAANTVLTMHYLPGANGQPNKAIPDRRLVREGRSGEGFDLVITRNGSSFRKVGAMDEWQQQAQQAQKLEKLLPLQEQALGALKQDGGWLTRRQVCEAIGVEWTERGRKGKPRLVGDALTRLVGLGAAESARAGTEATYRSTCGAQVTTVTTVPISDANGSQCHGADRDNRDKEEPPEDCHGCHETVRDTENAGPDSVARLSRLSRPASDLEAQPDLLPFSPAPVGSGSDVVDDGDDPWWPPRSTAA